MSTSIHCGNKFVFHNVIKTLFMNNTTTTTTKRKLSSLVSSPQPQKVIDYNKMLKGHAKTFKKTDSAQKEAIEILKEMEQKGIQPNSQTYLQLVIGMSFQRHRTHLQNERLQVWFDELIKIEKNKKTKSSTHDKLKKILFHLSFKGHPNLKSMFLQIIQEIDLDLEYWHMAMTGCIKSRKIDDAEDLLNLLRENKKATKSSYQILISSHLYLQDLSSASRIFSCMLQDQVTADHHTYELFIHHYMNQPFTQDTSETCFKLWQAVKMTTEHDKISQEIIEKYLSFFGKNGDLSKAEQIYLDVKEQGLNRKCVGEMNRIIIGFANKRQLPSALSLFYDLIGQGYKPSQQVIIKITEACKAMQDEEAIQQLLAVVEETKQQQQQQQQQGEISSNSCLKIIK
jgi:hypothetical protein